MPRVVPSQVTDFIAQTWPPAILAASKMGMHLGDIGLNVGDGGRLAALIALADKIPDELLTLTGGDYSDYSTALASIRFTLSQWIGGQQHPRVPSVHGRDPVLVVYEKLKLCPDQLPSPATATLMFIGDVKLRDTIRLDISAANSDLVNGEWKGATVLAGSATEALLLWAIQEAETRTPDTISSAIAAVVPSLLERKPNADPERWDFLELIEVARHLMLIKEDTATQSRLCKDFRNLIHPGRAARLAQVCDRGTALSALAAVELVVRDLTLNAA